MTAIIEPPEDIESFDGLDLSAIMRRALDDAGFDKPTPIQASLIPLALDGVQEKQARERAIDAMKAVDLSQRSSHYPSQLSFLLLPVEFHLEWQNLVHFWPFYE